MNETINVEVAPVVTETPAVETAPVTETPVVKAGKPKGRPKIYKGALAKNIARIIKANGLLKGQKVLAKEGVQLKPGTPRKKMKVSLPTLSKLAKEAGVILKRGRPKLKPAKKAA